MPVEYERDDQRRLIAVTVTDPYAIDDVLGTIDRQAAEDTWAYAMLYDLRAVDVLTGEYAQRIADHVQAVGAGRERGPVGIAIRSSPEHFRLGLRYAELAKQRVEVLLTGMQVDEWLIRNAQRRPQ